MITPLPEPVVLDVHIPSGYKIRGFTKDQLLEYAKAYGEAEYKRGLADAAAVADHHAQDFSSARMKEEWEVSVAIAELIRKLGETK